jgi:hypothetical protein
MNIASGSQLSAITNGRFWADRNAVGFRIERHDRTSLDVWCPIEEIGDFIRSLCDLAAASAPEDSPHPSHQAHFAPITALGIGFAAAETPDKTLLVMRLRGLGLAFEIPSSGLKALVEGMSQTALTLSSDGSTAH